MISQFQKTTHMKKSIIIIIAAFILIFEQATAQQDPNFTLYNFNMNIINPAFAGIKESPELNLVYRSQFLGIDDAPRTISMAYSKAMGKNIGFGVSVITDKVFVLNQTDLAIDISYKIQVGEKTNLYFGLKAGGGFTNIDLTRANNQGIDPLFSENQDFFNPHIGAGINIQNEKYFISISTPNLLMGKRYEKQGNTPSIAVDKSHYYIGGGYNFRINEDLSLMPRLMIRTVEGAPTSYDVGTSLDIQNKFQAGINFRVDEMTSFYLLLQVVDKLKLGAAYDMTTSDVNLVNDDGSLELILKYQF